MALRYINLGSLLGFHLFDDADFPEGFDTDAPIAAGAPVDDDHVLRKGDVLDAGGLDANKIVKTNALLKLDSVDDLTDFIDGTMEINVNDDGDGTVTVEGNGDTDNPTFISSIQAGGAGALGIQYKTQQLTISKGIVLQVGVESGWNDI